MNGGFLRGLFAGQKGVSLVESSLALGLVGLLAAAGLGSLDFKRAALWSVQEEFRGCLGQAFLLARARGRNVVVAMGRGQEGDVLPVVLPRGVLWGKPPHIPWPPGMDPAITAESTGMAHARITVTPRHTATATAWFVHDGREAVCVRLSGRGRLQILRWRADLRTWTRS